MSEMKLSPNGNGGFFNSLVKNQQVNEHVKQMEYVQIIGVDNILNKVLDPFQIGFTKITDSDVTLKSCSKRDSAEKVGVVAKKNGRYAIVEYSELDKEHAEATLEDGETLQFRHGSILIFMFKASSLLSLATSKEANSMYHKAQKKVDHFCMETKQTVMKADAWKFELFLQNFMPLIELGKLSVLEVKRQSEFAPIKNADDDSGVEVADSPASAQRLSIEQSVRWIERVTSVEQGTQLYISPLLSYRGENIDSNTVDGSQNIYESGYFDEFGDFTASR
jgi:UDP-N-acetylglucosamine/UDP-N-acetylgalactosamine diphosphorylase